MFWGGGKEKRSQIMNFHDLKSIFCLTSNFWRFQPNNFGIKFEAEHMGVFFLPARKTWIRPLFLDFFENRPNYAISMVHNVFQGHLEVAEHVFDIIFMFHHVFDSV